MRYLQDSRRGAHRAPTYLIEEWWSTDQRWHRVALAWHLAGNAVNEADARATRDRTWCARMRDLVTGAIVIRWNDPRQETDWATDGD